MKALAERGMNPKTVKVMGQGEITMDDAPRIKNMGDAGLGIINAVPLRLGTLSSKMNEDFVKAYSADYKRNPMCSRYGGWDGMHLTYEALKKTGGKADGDLADRGGQGHEMESPRGPISIDLETRDIVQTVLQPQGRESRRHDPERRIRQDRERQGSEEVKARDWPSELRRSRFIPPPKRHLGRGRGPRARRPLALCHGQSISPKAQFTTPPPRTHPDVEALNLPRPAWMTEDLVLLEEQARRFRHRRIRPASREAGTTIISIRARCGPRPAAPGCCAP